jgi:hypothetical protein
MQMKPGHVMRAVGLDDPDALRAKGVSRPHSCPASSARPGFPAHAPALLSVRLRVIPRLQDNARLGRSPSGRVMRRIAGKAMPDTRVIGHTKTPRHFP